MGGRSGADPKKKFLLELVCYFEKEKEFHFHEGKCIFCFFALGLPEGEH